MQLYRELYYQLFAATADAVEAMEQMDFGTAKDILIQAQQTAEEAVLSQADRQKQAPEAVSTAL